MENKRKKVLSISITALLMLIIVTCCFLAVDSYALATDDFIYQNIMGTNTRVHNIADIIHSQYIHYFEWGGRTVAHIIVQLLLLLGKPLSSIIITAGILLLAYFICKNVFGNAKIALSSGIIAITGIFLLNPSLEETLFWITGTGNYLFTIVIVLVFIYPYRLLAENEHINHDNAVMGTVKAVGMLLLGVIAGWTNENLGAALVITLLGLMVWLVKFKKNGNLQSNKLPIWSYAGVVGAVIGFIVLLIAPGNLKRNDAILDMYGSVVKIVLHRIYMMERALFTYLWVIALITGLLVAAKVYLKKQKLSVTEIIFLIMGALSYFTMLASPTYPDRVTFSTVCLFLIVCISIVNQFAKDKKEYGIVVDGVAVFMLMTFVCQSITRVLLPLFK
ncbi:MAG: DUF6056 family protein [Oscillospiraceae bacterium]